MGGNISYDSERGRLQQWLQHLLGRHVFDDVDDVWFRRYPATDRACAAIAEFDNIEYVHLVGSAELTDEGLRHFAELSQLKSLLVAESAITDEGLRHLVHLPRLRNFVIFSVPIWDEGIKTIRRMSHLEKLSIINVPLTDASVPTLGQMTSLEYLALRNTAISEQDVRRLREALPNTFLYVETW